MKKIIITLTLLITFSTVFSQNNVNTLRDSVKILQNNNYKLRNEFNNFRTQTKQDFDKLQLSLDVQNSKIVISLIQT